MSEQSDSQMNDDVELMADASDFPDDDNSAVKAKGPAPMTASEHAQVREQMSKDVEAFLASGGKIQQVDVNVMADPPRKPQSNYGSRPI